MRCHPLLNGSSGHESLGKRSTSQENPEQGQPAENKNAVIPSMHTRHPVQGPCTCLHVFTAVKGWESPGVPVENCTACLSWDPEFVPLSCVNWVIVALCRSGVQGHLQSQAFPSQWHEIMGWKQQPPWWNPEKSPPESNHGETHNQKILYPKTKWMCVIFGFHLNMDNSSTWYHACTHTQCSALSTVPPIYTDASLHLPWRGWVKCTRSQRSSRSINGNRRLNFKNVVISMLKHRAVMRFHGFLHSIQISTFFPCDRVQCRPSWKG